ncbi:hypothetical protein VP193E371_P0042 [Vibrio phage 193E37-1]|nr:hypothetical protein VP193E371_P0042 [Vibrio phage 193E37-1]
MRNWLWGLAAKTVQSNKKALELQDEEERCRIEEFLNNASQKEVFEKIRQLEHALLWREFRYRHDKSIKGMVDHDMNPRGFSMLTREEWK